MGNDVVNVPDLPFSSISIHVPAWGTTECCLHPLRSHEFQSTFPRGERQGVTHYLGVYEYISIHVPAWGTTLGKTKSLNELKFQSTFPRGERRMPYLQRLGNCNFNPRSRVGNDVVMTYDDYAYGISIHVPAWGTTVTAIGVLTGQIFQSTFPRGERRFLSKMSANRS